MRIPARNSLAIVGAGPVGLEAAVAALDAGLDVHVFERGEIGEHVRAWGHVQMFTPWRMNIGLASGAALDRSGWQRPDAEACPTGAELVQEYLDPLGRLAELKSRIHTHTQVVHVSRAGVLKGDSNVEPGRAAHPFRLLVRDQGGRENFLHAFALIDASGTYGQPSWAGDGGIPARNELYLAPQLSYHLDDVLDLRRERYAGKRTLVIGAGATAATLVSDLAKLADDAPGTHVAWATRKPAHELYRLADDPLPVRRALYQRARDLAAGHPAVTHIGGMRVEGLEYNSATHRYRATLEIGDQPRVEEVDQILVATGFGPDNSLYRELQVHECYASRGPMKLAAALAGSTDCLNAPAVGIDLLSNPEPNFWILGHKSYGKSSHFLLETGYKQVAEVVAKLTEDLKLAVAR
jgi:thioredoxin reductase